MRRRFKRKTSGNVPKYAMPGKYSISPTEQVYFSQGFMYYEPGSGFGIEEDQFQPLTAYNTNHISFFYHTPYSADAITLSPPDSAFVSADTFAADGGAIKKWTVLSNAEAYYLLCTRGTGDTRMNLANIGDGGWWQNPKYLVVAPDDNTTPIQTAYTTQEFIDTGFLCIPKIGDAVPPNGTIVLNNTFMQCKDCPTGYTGTISSYVWGLNCDFNPWRVIPRDEIDQWGTDYSVFTARKKNYIMPIRLVYKI